MLRASWNPVAAIALAIVLASYSMAGAQPPLPPSAPTSGVTSPAQYRALTPADVQENLAQVKAAAVALDQRFATAGPSAEGWKVYLSWPTFQTELQQATPNKSILADAYAKLAAGFEGLELKAFADLRAALGDYLAIADSVGSPDLAAAVKSQVDDLAKELQAIKATDAQPTSDQYRKIADHVLWLAMARQTPELIQDVRTRFSVPNFSVHIGKEIIDLGVAGPIDEVAPIDDVILGTVVHGTGRTVGQTHAAVNADPETASRFATFDVMLQAVNYSNNIGRNGPVCIYTTGQTGLAACKRFWFDAAGIHVYTAATNAQACTTINDIVSIKGRRIVENIAWRRAGKQKAEAEAIASQHAAARLRERVDVQADPPVQNANVRYQTKVVAPLTERRAFPQSLRFSTLPGGIAIEGALLSQAQMAAATAPPQLACQADSSHGEAFLSVCIHESMINNLAENILSGMRLNDEMVQRMVLDLTGSVPEKLKSQDQEPFTVVFPSERVPRAQPVTVSFADNGLAVTLRGQEYYTGDRKQPGMNITANYKFVKTPEGYKAVRQGDLLIYGFGQKPGTKRSLRQQGIYTALQTKFGKLFEAEIRLQGFKFAQGRLAAAGQFVPVEIIAQNGWLAIAYGRGGATSAKLAKN